MLIKLDCEFIMTPRIVFNDKTLTRTDGNILGLIISLAFKHGYCFATNNYISEYIKVKSRTVSDSLSRLKKQQYIKIKYVDNKRRIYLNTEKIPVKSADAIANNCSKMVAENCYHNINNKYKNKYIKNKEIVPYWLEHPEVCKSDLATPEEIAEMDELLKEFK